MNGSVKGHSEVNSMSRGNEPLGNTTHSPGWPEGGVCNVRGSLRQPAQEPNKNSVSTGGCNYPFFTYCFGQIAAN